MFGTFAKRPLALALAVLVLVTLLLFLVKPDASDSTDRKSEQIAAQVTRLSTEKLLENLKSTDPLLRYHALVLLRTQGLEAALAVPTLIETLADTGSFDRRQHFNDQAAETLTAIGSPAVPQLVVALSQAGDSTVRALAARALGGMGPEAQAAIPALQAALDDDAARISAAYALWQIDPQGKLILPTLFPHTQLPIPNLIEALDHPRLEVRKSAARALGAMGTAASQATPTLLRALEDRELRPLAAQALATAATSQGLKAVTPTLLKMLHDGDPRVRQATILALGRSRAKNHAVVLALSGALEDPDVSVRKTVFDVLTAMGPAAKPAVPRLIRMLREDREVDFAVSLLGTIGPPAREAVPDLVAIYEKGKESGRGYPAVWPLGRIGPAEIVLPILLESMRAPLKSPRSGHRDNAIRAIGFLGPAAREAIPELIGQLDETFLGGTGSAMTALHEIGPEAIPYLIEALRSADNWNCRAGAALTLAKFGPAGKAAIPALQQALHDGESRVALEAAFALVNLHFDGDEAIQVLLRALREDLPRDTGGLWHLEVVTSRMISLAPALHPIAPMLIAMLGENNPALSWRVIPILSAMGPVAKGAVPALVELTKSDDPHMRDAATFALVDVGADAQIAVTALCDRLKEPTRRELKDAVPVIMGPGGRVQLLNPLRVNRPLLAEKLGGYGPAARSAAGELGKFLESRHPNECMTGLEALGKMGPAAEEAIPALRKLLDEPQNYLAGRPRSRGQEDTSFFAGAGDLTEKPEFAGLPPDNPPSVVIPVNAIKVLSAIGPAAMPALPSLLHALKDERLTVRHAAASAIRLLDPKAAALRLSQQELESNWDMLKDKDPINAYRAAWALIADPPRSLPWLRDRLRPAQSLSIAPVVDAEPAPEQMRELRAVSVFEKINTTESRALLEGFAKPTPADSRARAARAALDRMARGSP